MASLPAIPHWSASEYLQFEASSSVRHEFFDGMVVAMAGGSDRHAFLATNLIIDIGSQLEGSRCRTAASDFHLHFPESKAYFYPDVTVVCQEIPNGPSQAKLVIEVLSPSTESIDREYKRSVYRASATILDYLIVHQDLVFVEHDTRSQAGEAWKQFTYADPQQKIFLPSLNLTLSLARIYRSLEFARS